MSKPTPGPWLAITGSVSSELHIVGAGGKLIADLLCAPIPHIKKEMDDNARLIAAAPELLAVAERVVHNGPVRMGEKLWQAAVESVQKARGES